ncbi:glycosyltransferase, partial [Methylobacterium frigidaeris]
ASWPVEAAVARRLRYTGYVDEAETSPAPGGPRSGIVVSGGSSAAGLPLQEAAVAAAALTPDLSWRILVGRAVPEPAFAGLAAAAPANAIVERARPDFRALLAGAALSVSQAGYNTVLDLLHGGCPALLVPFEAGQETEQRLRAETLAAHGLARVLPESELTAEHLAAAALSTPPPATGHAIARDGARRSVAIVEEMLGTPVPTGKGRAPARHPSPDVTPLTDALARAADEGRTVTLWWRDDDATAHTPALDRLLALAARTGWPVALAAVPARAEPSLTARIADEPGIDLLVHGLAHANHAPADARKAEFGSHRPLAALRADAVEALALSHARLGHRLLPVLVPPWNRIAPDLPEHLPALHYRGLSAAHPLPPVPGLAQAHAAIDPIAWRSGGGLADPEGIVARAARAVAEGGPVGLLTHHLVQDGTTWDFCERLLDCLASHAAKNRASRISRAAALFAPAASPVSQTDPIFR